MIIRNYKDVEAKIPEEQGAVGVRMRRVIAEKEGAKNFILRVFEIEPNGHTPMHKHDWEHEIFILNGSGIAISQSGEYKVKSGDAILVPANEEHQFKNTGDKTWEIICLIPIKK